MGGPTWPALPSVCPNVVTDFRHSYQPPDSIRSCHLLLLLPSSTANIKPPNVVVFDTQRNTCGPPRISLQHFAICPIPCAPHCLDTSRKRRVGYEPCPTSCPSISTRRSLGSAVRPPGSAWSPPLSDRPGPFTVEVSQVLKIKNPNTAPVAFKVTRDCLGFSFALY